MRYLGGKSKIRKQVKDVIEHYRGDKEWYFEPFVGGGWVLQEVEGKRIASDGNAALVTMYKALQDGWIPPDFVSEYTWRQYKTNPVPDDPMTAFCRIGCGFGGDWNGGYARSEGKECYAATTKRSLLKQLPLIQNVKFRYGLFHEHKPKDCIIYCDPPYQGTTQYGAFSGFDHELFWNTVREWSKSNTVLVSEYQAPDDFKCVAEFPSRMGLRTEGFINEIRTERMFVIKEA